MRSYFHSYYSLLKDRDIIKSEEDVAADINAMVIKYAGGRDNKENLTGHDLADVSMRVDKYLEKYNKSLAIFTVGNSKVVNCWLGDIVEKKKVSKYVWGKEVLCRVKVIDRLVIHDFNYFLSSGKEAYEIGTRNGIIYYNLEAFRARAGAIWDIFRSREEENKSRRYDPSRSNRLRRKLYDKVWLDIYSECLKSSNDLEAARNLFIDKAVSLLKDNSLLHEMGHIFAGKYLALNNDAAEEEAAFLTELRYGPLPYESLDMVISASYQNSITAYSAAGRDIIASFISYVQNEQKNKNTAYKHINIPNTVEARKMENLFELTEDQIRSISEYIFEQKFQVL